MAAGFSLSFSIEGEKQLSRRLRLTSDKVKDWEPAFKQSAEYLHDIFSDKVFASQGGVIGERWSPLSKAYAFRKNKLYPGRGILEATGTMKNGFMTLWRPDMAQVWNKVEYFKYHQSNQARSKMPRRVMMKLAQAQRTQIVKVFHTYFASIVHP